MNDQIQLSMSDDDGAFYGLVSKEQSVDIVWISMFTKETYPKIPRLAKAYMKIKSKILEKRGCTQ